MKMNGLLAVAALALAATPIAVSAQAADRASAPVEGASNMGADGPTITALLAVAGLIAAVIIVADNDDDEPVSA